VRQLGLNTTPCVAVASLVHQWEPRFKLVGLLGLIVAVANVTDRRLIPVILAIAVAMYALARLPLSFWCDRLRYPGFFLMGMVVALPFLTGKTVVWQWGWLSLRTEGLWAALLITSRFITIFTLGLVLLGTTPFLSLVKAMQQLGLPTLLTDMLLLTYRYLQDLAEHLSKLQRSAQLRGVGKQGTIARLQLLAALSGSLLVQSYDRSEDIYRAMRLRGYGHLRRSAAAPISVDVGSAIGLGLSLLTAGGLIAAEWLLNHVQGNA